MSWPWSQLGLSGPCGLPDIRHAYAEKLKTAHPEEDPEGFQRLHAAYRAASRLARQKGREGPSLPPRPPEGEPLQRDEPPAGPRPEADWDYDRLFAEGAEERLKDLRCRAMERRRKQGLAELPEPRPVESRCDWQSLEAVLRALETMYNVQAGQEDWRQFFAEPLFQRNRFSPDLIFGLEDFVSGHPDLSREVRIVLFRVYGFDKGAPRPELRVLHQMLLPAWKEDRKKHGFPWRTMLWAFAVDIVLLFSLGPILDSGLIPIALSAAGLAFIFWVVWRVVKTGSIGRPADKSREERAAIKGILAMAAVILALSWLRSMPEDAFWRLFPTPDPREQVCRYIEEDYGVEVYSLYNESDYYANDTYSNVFCLEEHPMRQFLSGPDGERDTKNGRPGYTTNLPEMLLLWELKDFMFQRDIYDVDSLDQGLEQWETTGTFLITLPEEGGEEIIEDLGALLEELSGEKWYRVRQPQCQLVVCVRGDGETPRVLCRWRPGETFATEEVRTLYEEGADGNHPAV